jgi:hypothetical protein
LGRDKLDARLRLILNKSRPGRKGKRGADVRAIGLQGSAYGASHIGSNFAAFSRAALRAKSASM